MRHATGALGWSPREFWRSTPIELHRAIDGWLESQGVDPDVEAPEPISMQELEDLMERFPDGGSIKGSPTARTMKIGGSRG